LKSKTAYITGKLRAFNIAVFLCCCALVFLSSCAVVEFAKPEAPPSNTLISSNYVQTEIKTSTSADVLTVINMPEYEMLSQSKSVIASVGQKKRGYKAWFNMVAFDEEALTARRKYLFIEDERPKSLFVEPWAYAKFDCKMVIESEVLDKPYSNENAKRIAILKQVKENLNNDLEVVRLDNKILNVEGMIINQGLAAVLTTLDTSPGQAAKLSEYPGVEFSNLTYDKGRIRMLLNEDVVTVEMKLGSIVKKRLGIPVGSLEEMQIEEEIPAN